MAELNEEEIRQMEKVAMEREVEWLVDKEVPRALAEMSASVEKCVALLHTSKRLVSFGSARSRLSGFLQLDGWDVLEGEVNIAMQKGAFKGQIASKVPLSQMHNAHNYMKCALELLDDFPEFSARYRHFQMGHLARELKQISSCIIQAKQELVLPTSTAFPKNLLARNLVFTPPLPSHLSVNINVLDARVLVTVYLIHTSASRPLHRGSIGPNIVGNSFKVDGKWVEVMDQDEIPLTVPYLDRAFELLHEAYQCATELQTKITALDPS